MRRIFVFFTMMTMAAGLFISPLLSRDVLAVDLDCDQQLTIYPATEEFMDEDPALESTAVADIYRVAVAQKDPDYDTIHFTALAPYESLQDKLSDETSLTAAAWESLAVKAAAIALQSDSPVEGGEGVSMGDKFTLPKGSQETAAGLYLVLVRSGDVSISNQKEYFDGECTFLETKKYKYTLKPLLVSLPTTNGDIKPDENGEGPVIMTSDGEWFSDVKVTIKPARSDLEEEEPPKTPDKPKTGDDTNILPIVIVVLLSGAALLALLVFDRRRRRNQEGEEK